LHLIFIIPWRVLDKPPNQEVHLFVLLLSQVLYLSRLEIYKKLLNSENYYRLGESSYSEVNADDVSDKDFAKLYSESEKLGRVLDRFRTVDWIGIEKELKLFSLTFS
jgi:hypothetical protein